MLVMIDPSQSLNKEERLILFMRHTQYPIGHIFIERHSPRALSDEIAQQEVMSLFEAARWAPSSSNFQPWRFLYAMKDDEHWDTFFNLLAKGNQIWAKNAGVLVVIISKRFDEDKGREMPTHIFDTGAAWMGLALQAQMMGLRAHGMAGFDYEKAREDLMVPEEYDVCAMAAVGRPADKKILPEKLQEREVLSSRKAVSEIAFRRTFSNTVK